MTQATAESETRILTLPDRLDTAACEPLYAEFMAARGVPLQLDAGNVTFVGGLALQLLLSAEAEWAEEGQPFAVVRPSDGFSSGLALLGVPETIFEQEPPA